MVYLQWWSWHNHSIYKYTGLDWILELDTWGWLETMVLWSSSCRVCSCFHDFFGFGFLFLGLGISMFNTNFDLLFSFFIDSFYRYTMYYSNNEYNLTYATIKAWVMASKFIDLLFEVSLIITYDVINNSPLQICREEGIQLQSTILRNALIWSIGGWRILLFNLVY